MECSFSGWLAEELAKAHLRPIRFAEVLGANRSTVTRWLRDQSLPDAESSRRIALALGIDPSVVLERAGHITQVSELRFLAAAHELVSERHNELERNRLMLEAVLKELDARISKALNHRLQLEEKLKHVSRESDKE